MYAIRSYYAPLAGPETVTVDARGATVTPGFTDAHIHLVAWARSRAELGLFGCMTRNEALQRVRDVITSYSIHYTKLYDPAVWAIQAGVLAFGVAPVCLFLAAGRRKAGGGPLRLVRDVVAALLLGIGLSVNNARAVLA